VIRPPSIVTIPGQPTKGFIRPVYREQMYRPTTPSPVIVAAPAVRLPVEKRMGACGQCRFYMPAAKLAFRFELELEKIAADLMLCGHPNCGCWRNRDRVEPWKRWRCPEGRW